MILNSISRRLVQEDKSEIKMILDAGTYSIDEFSQKMKDVIKGKTDQWVAAQIKDFKLVIPESHTFIALKPFFDVLEITPIAKFLLGEYQTKLQLPPTKVALYCEELDKFQNEIDN